MPIHERVDQPGNGEDSTDDGAQRGGKVGERFARLARDDLERRDLVVEKDAGVEMRVRSRLS